MESRTESEDSEEEDENYDLEEKKLPVKIPNKGKPKKEEMKVSEEMKKSKI